MVDRDESTAGLLPLIDPKAVLKEFVDASTRPDGRRMEETRPLEVDVGAITLKHGGHALNIGSATARVGGNTTAHCSIGLVGICADTDPALKFSVSVGTSGRSAEWARRLETLLADAYVTFPRCEFLLGVSVTCLCDYGGLVDCCAMAVVGALSDARLPETTRAKEDVLEITKLRAFPLPSFFAFPLTCVVFESTVLSDPTLIEESLGTLVTVLVKDDSETIFKIRQDPNGQYATTRHILVDCVNRAFERAASAFDRV